MTGTDGSLPDACTAALTNGAKWGIFLKAPVEGIEKGILWDTGAAMIWSGIEVVITGLTRNPHGGMAAQSQQLLAISRFLRLKFSRKTRNANRIPDNRISAFSSETTENRHAAVSKWS
ncbi:hypothetical protein [Intestinimonas butyriciproducens]|nr:hypothetical protein [Intestinimonas butyriciproducens]MBO3280273.1 hypothetical protein [Intestinimonas butyriciproducens]